MGETIRARACAGTGCGRRPGDGGASYDPYWRRGRLLWRAPAVAAGREPSPACSMASGLRLPARCSPPTGPIEKYRRIATRCQARRIARRRRGRIIMPRMTVLGGLRAPTRRIGAGREQDRRSRELNDELVRRPSTRGDAAAVAATYADDAYVLLPQASWSRAGRDRGVLERCVPGRRCEPRPSIRLRRGGARRSLRIGTVTGARRPGRRSRSSANTRSCGARSAEDGCWRPISGTGTSKIGGLGGGRSRRRKVAWQRVIGSR